MRFFNRQTLAAELARAQAHGWEQACAEAEEREGLPRGLLLAIASHETDMNDVVGDSGHGRGLFQIDDRSHGRFLASCRPAAERQGGKPPVVVAARYAATLVKQNLAYGRKQGIGERDLLKFGVSAYNAGAGGAWEGFKLGDSDRKTTGGDYARDVLGRHAIFRELLGEPTGRRLRRGMRGPDVEELKRKLAGWYARHAPADYARFAVKDGPLFGASLEGAVRDFQQRVGLEVDGIAGPKTVSALTGGKPPRRGAGARRSRQPASGSGGPGPS